MYFYVIQVYPSIILLPYKMIMLHITPTKWPFLASRPAQVMFLMLVLQHTPTLRLMVEQPCSSWGFKQLFFVSLIATFKLYIVKTHMGFFNHDLCKCSHLLTNMRILGDGSRMIMMDHVVCLYVFECGFWMDLGCFGWFSKGALYPQPMICNLFNLD